MRNAKNVLITALSVIALLTPETFSQGADKLSLLGISLDLSQRFGTLEFDREHREDIGKPWLLTQGFAIGKRWRISPGLRLQMIADIRYGRVSDDTLPSLTFMYSDGTIHQVPTALIAKFLSGDFVVDFQVPLSRVSGRSWYLHAGGGAHIVDISESEVTIETPPSYVKNDPYLVSQIMLSTSVRAGLGVDLPMSPRYGLTFDYSLRYGFPVRYPMQRDLFPTDPVPYHERFLSHELNILLAIARARDTAKLQQTYWLMPSLGVTKVLDQEWDPGIAFGTSLMMAVNPELYVGSRVGFNVWGKTGGSTTVLELVPFVEPSIPFTFIKPGRVFLHGGAGYYWVHYNDMFVPSVRTIYNGNEYKTGLTLGGGVGIRLNRKTELTVLPLYNRMLFEQQGSTLFHYGTVDVALSMRIY